MVGRPPAPAVLRGLAAGALTAALALAAHAAAGGMVSSGAAALLVLVSAALGALISGAPRTTEVPALIVLLGAGQLVGHLTLAAAEPCHTGSPGPAMLSAHLLAVVAGGLLISGAERLCQVLSTALGLCAAPEPGRWAMARSARAPRPDHPLQSRHLISVSISHRGPPSAWR